MRVSSISKQNLSAAIKMIAAACIAKFSKKHIWIITERPGQARDNGYVLFKYIRETDPDFPCFYVIDQNSEDYKKIGKLGNAIQFNSWKHFLIFCQSKIHISAHVNGCCPDYSVSTTRRLKKKIGYKDVFIPHGVSYGISEFCLKKYTDINLFICSGKPEYDNVLANYGYSLEEVAYTGFPRLDRWHGNKVNPKQIFLMPTWRAYLAQNPDLKFEETQYYKTWQSLLNNTKLAEYLTANNMKLIFYPHNEMRKYIDSFSTECSNIEIVYQDSNYDIQELLKSSALLITDYSSVHFDFAYMNKPVIYYQFDKEEFFSKQYMKSDFDAGSDGFGPVACEEADLVATLIQAGSQNFRMQPEYYDRMRSFYQLYDDQNCKRVYQTIKERIDK